MNTTTKTTIDTKPTHYEYKIDIDNARCWDETNHTWFDVKIVEDDKSITITWRINT